MNPDQTSRITEILPPVVRASRAALCTGPVPAAGLTRRHFLNRFGMGLGGIALAHLLNPLEAAAQEQAFHGHGGILAAPHFPPKAKRVIYLFMAGGPSQLETFDYKPLLNQRNGEGPAGVGPHGPAPDRYVRQPGDFSRWPVRFSNFNSMARRAPG